MQREAAAGGWVGGEEWSLLCGTGPGPGGAQPADGLADAREWGAQGEAEPREGGEDEESAAAGCELLGDC